MINVMRINEDKFPIAHSAMTTYGSRCVDAPYSHAYTDVVAKIDVDTAEDAVLTVYRLSDGIHADEDFDLEIGDRLVEESGEFYIVDGFTTFGVAVLSKKYVD